MLQRASCRGIGGLPPEWEGAAWRLRRSRVAVASPTIQAVVVHLNQPITDAPVLVVDDLPANRWLLSRLVESLGLKCFVASDGWEAITAVQLHRFSLILMDIEMERLDGDEAARRLRQRELAGSRVPIIAVTSLPIDEAVERCRRAGVDGILRKPVCRSALRTQLRRHAPQLFANC